MDDSQKRWLYLIVLSLIWGSSFILIKKALISLSPIQVGALRIIFSALTLFAFSVKSVFTITKQQWYYIGLTALLGTFFPVFLFAFAVKNIDSSITSILNSLTPINTLIVGVTFFGLSFLRKQITGIITGLIGALFLIIKGSNINPDQNYFYAIFVIIASIGYAFNINILKKHLQGLSALTITTGNFVVIFIPAIMVLWSTDFLDLDTIQNTKTSLIYIIILSIIGTAAAKILFNKLIQISSPIFSSSVTYLITIVAVFWGILDGENIHYTQIIASILILLGIYLTNKNKT